LDCLFAICLSCGFDHAENLFLRHQLNIALRRAMPRPRLRGSDWAVLVWITWLWPSLVGAAQVVQPETILRWHRTGFKAFWRWKSRKQAGSKTTKRQSHQAGSVHRELM
jgi:hypothetical protein